MIELNMPQLSEQGGSMTDRELLQQALDALISVWNSDRTTRQVETIRAIKARLAQPEPKPVGCITEVHTKTAYGGTVGIEPQMYGRLPVGTLLYTAPPKKEWVGLTDEEIIDAANMAPFDTMVSAEDYIYIISRAIEAKLKEKNAA